MLNIGCHLSSSEGYLKMGTTALEINANTFAFFTRNPRGGAAKEIIIDDVNAFNELSSKNNFAKLVAHAPYTLNPCSAKVETREYALELISDDLKRMEFTPNNYYNFHPGSHTGQGVEIGIEETAELLNKVLTKNQTTIVLLETMAGKGSEIGSSFEELQAIIDKVELKEKVGVCFDTCHTFDSGYDIVNDLDGVLKHFDDIIGLEKLYAIHLNDSMYGFESHKDRHAKIGEGLIGIDAIKRIINHPSLRNLPFILETPNEVDGYKKEIVLLKSLSK